MHWPAHAKKENNPNSVHTIQNTVKRHKWHIFCFTFCICNGHMDGNIIASRVGAKCLLVGHSQ